MLDNKCRPIVETGPVFDGSRPIVTCEDGPTVAPVDPVEPVNPIVPDPAKLCTPQPNVECCTAVGGVIIAPVDNLCTCGFSVLGAGVDDNKTFTPSSGFLIITENNAVIDCIDHTGCILIRANNVTIRNSIIDCDSTAPGIRQEALYTGAVIEGNTIIGGPMGTGAGVSGGNMTVVGNEIRGTVDGIQVTDGNTLIEGNYIYNLFDTILPGGGISHNDNIQVLNGSNITINKNVMISEISPSHNSVVFAQSDFGPISNLTVSNNYVVAAGWTIRFNNDVTGFIIDNTVGVSPLPQFGPILVSGGSSAVVSCNVWESGAVIAEGGNTCIGTPTAIRFDDLSECKC